LLAPFRLGPGTRNCALDLGFVGISIGRSKTLCNSSDDTDHGRGYWIQVSDELIGRCTHRQIWAVMVVRLTDNSAHASRQQRTVVVIDDDQDVREALKGLLQSVGLHVALFASVQQFLTESSSLDASCMVLDVRLPGQSGLDFFDEIVDEKMNIPVVFISGHADVPMSVRAMKSGAIEFLTKPVRQQDLLEAIHLAIQRNQTRREEARALASVQAAFDTLTLREREVMTMVVAGSPNKQIAAKIGISVATVKLHRGRVMRKMQANSLADLVRMADRIAVSVR
jgi:FixJ family two-component response regulator